MEHNVIKDNKYLVSTKAETTVTDPQSGWSKVIPANKQEVVVALSDKLSTEGECDIRPFVNATRTHLELNPSSAGGGASGDVGTDYMSYIFAGDGTFSIDGEMPNLTNGEYMFHSYYTGLTSFTADLSALTNGHYMFHNRQLNKESALRVLNTIPSYSSGNHPLMLGIHVDHQADEEVLAAIDSATAKGWTLTTQWNGTPTSGVSLMGLDEIYAKKEQNPDGMYVDSNGVRYMVDWGHMVTSPDATPAELGYKLYYSLDEALTEWGLTEYEDNTISNQ